MTAARRQRKSRRELIFFLVLAGAGLTSPVGRLSFAATTERIVSDPSSGLAISGFDPVAYFTDAGPRLGGSDFELSFAGVVWRFRNEGNRAAFVANPEVYMPRFGGYDPISVARGASAPGHAELWAIAEERLYLFYSAAARDTFAGDPGSAIGAAERSWPTTPRNLSVEISGLSTWTTPSSDRLDLYYAADANNPAYACPIADFPLQGDWLARAKNPNVEVVPGESIWRNAMAACAWFRWPSARRRVNSAHRCRFFSSR